MITGVQHESVCEGANVEAESHDKIRFASFMICQVETNHLFLFF